MSHVSRIASHIALSALLLLAACGAESTPTTTRPPQASSSATTSEPTSTTTTTQAATTTTSQAFECPVTPVPDEPFVPPDPYPAEPPVGTWYGTPELWTVVTDEYVQRKSVWWSVNFPGGAEEEQPPITVGWVRLDDPDAEAHTHDGGTNAYTAEDGWFMISGIDPPEGGCYEVTATYKGTSLTYVYESP